MITVIPFNCNTDVLFFIVLFFYVREASHVPPIYVAEVELVGGEKKTVVLFSTVLHLSHVEDSYRYSFVLTHPEVSLQQT